MPKTNIFYICMFPLVVSHFLGEAANAHNRTTYNYRMWQESLARNRQLTNEIRLAKEKHNVALNSLKNLRTELARVKVECEKSENPNEFEVSEEVDDAKKDIEDEKWSERSRKYIDSVIEKLRLKSK